MWYWSAKTCKMILTYQINSLQNIFLLSALGLELCWNLYVRHTPKMGYDGYCGSTNSLKLSQELSEIMKTFLAHQLTVLRHTKCKKNHVIWWKNCEVIQLLNLVAIFVFFFLGGEASRPCNFWEAKWNCLILFAYYLSMNTS